MIGAAVLVDTTAASVSALEQVCGTVVGSKLRRAFFVIADRGRDWRARALPPFIPPLRPSSTAAASLPVNFPAQIMSFGQRSCGRFTGLSFICLLRFSFATRARRANAASDFSK